MLSMIPISVEFAIREAVKLLRASRRNFKSRQVEQARELLELAIKDIPAPVPKKS
jgi:hypothetical protein